MGHWWKSRRRLIAEIRRHEETSAIKNALILEMAEALVEMSMDPQRAGASTVRYSVN